MGNQALHTLSLQYIRGQISKPEYRQRRRQIINEATGFTGTDVTEPETVVKKSGTPEYITTENSTTETGPLLKAGIISAIIVVMIIVLYTAI